MAGREDAMADEPDHKTIRAEEVEGLRELITQVLREGRSMFYSIDLPSPSARNGRENHDSTGQAFCGIPHLFRENARKTLFTRDGDGTHRLVSLAGEVAGTAQALMDVFTGRSRDGQNIGLLNRLWLRLYGSPMPEKLVIDVDCKLQEESYPRDRLFDLRMGLKLDIGKQTHFGCGTFMID